MVNLAHLPRALQNLLGEITRQSGIASGFVQRRSKLSAERFVQTLIFGWLANPSASLQQLTQTSALLGTTLSAQALDQRFSPQAAACLKLVLEAAITQVIAADGVAPALLQRFTRVELLDTSVISLPEALLPIWVGCGGTRGETSALKVEVGLDLLSGTLSGPYLHSARTADAQGILQNTRLTPGSLRLADLAYFKLSLFNELTRQQVYWLSRIKAITGILDEHGKAWKLLDYLRSRKRQRIDARIRLGYVEQVECRLLAVKVRQEVANERRRKWRDKARRNCRALKKENLELADWTIYVTNVEEERLSLEEALILARARWQIELLFKLWKSQGQIDEWRSHKPWRILCEVYAKLLAMLIQHWIVVVSGWRYADRSLEKASQVVRMMAIQLARVLPKPKQMQEILQSIGRCIGASCRVHKRKKAPSSFQLLSGEALA